MVTYRFPTWLLTRSFAVFTAWSSTRGLGVNIRFPRLISPNSRIFYLVEQRDIEGVKEMFRRGLGSPFDATVDSGATALRVRKY